MSSAPPSDPRISTRKSGICRVAYGLKEPVVSDLTQNISLSGLFIRTPYVFDVGTELTLELEVYDPQEKTLSTMRFLGRVVRLQPEAENPGMGVTFFDLDAEKEAFLARVIAKIPKIEPDGKI